MANIIKIKRSVSGTSAPAALARGELAYSEGGEDLYIGSGTETAGAAANIVKLSSGFGIADLDAVRIDDADAADNDYAKFTANGLEGRSASEARTDLSVDPAGTDNSTNVSLAGSYDYITAGGTGNQTLTLGQVVLTTDVSGVLPAANVVALNAITSPTASVSMNSQRLTGLAAPTAPNDAARKADVDAAVQGLDVHDSVRVISTVDIPAGNIASNSGAYVVDGVTLAEGDRVLLQNQSPASENGIYAVNTPSGSTHSMSRAADANAAADLSANMFFFVEEGTANADTGWVCTTNETLSTTNMVFAQFSGTGSFTAGDGLDLTGTVFSADLKANGGVEFQSGEIALNLGSSSITGTLAVADGGTGATTLTTGTVLLGNAASAITQLAKQAAGKILTSEGTAGGDGAVWSDSLSGITIDCGTY